MMRLAIGTLTFVWSLSALAFHPDTRFADPAEEGGGGGLYYTGSPRHKNYTCDACHINARGQIQLELSSNPQGLFEEQEYEPDTSYTITVEMTGESRDDPGFLDYNTFALETIDGDEEAAGTFHSFDPGLLRTAAMDGILFARATAVVEDQFIWTFQWTAPPVGTGHVDFYLAGVDGNGAGVESGPATDPLGDDVATRSLRVAESGVPAPAFRPAQPRKEGASQATCGALGVSSLTLWLIALASVWACRRRRT